MFSKPCSQVHKNCPNTQKFQSHWDIGLVLSLLQSMLLHLGQMLDWHNNVYIQESHQGNKDHLHYIWDHFHHKHIWLLISVLLCMALKINVVKFLNWIILTYICTSPLLNNTYHQMVLLAYSLTQKDNRISHYVTMWSKSKVDHFCIFQHILFHCWPH